MMKDKHSFSSMSIFFVPLALQAISQSLTYPLVAMVAARGPEGYLNIAALAQASAVLFLIHTITHGLFTSGMIYTRTMEGYSRFCRVNMFFLTIIIVAQIVICIPFCGDIVFGKIMGLKGRMEELTYITFVLMLPMGILFNLRNPQMVMLFREHATGKAYAATLCRIILTLIMSYVFSKIGLVGIFWAVVCQTIPVGIEAVVTHFLAMPLIRKLPKAGEYPASFKEMVYFTLSFSVGKVFIAFSGYFIGAAAARAPGQDITLPVYYAVIGIFNPILFASTRIQTLVIAFGRGQGRNVRLFIFTAIAGMILGFVPILFLLPWLRDWYYVNLQRLPIEYMPRIVETALCLMPLSLAIAFRSYVEGWAAYHKKPVSVIAGQGVYLSFVAIPAFFALNWGLAGNLIGPVALLAGNLFAIAGIMLSLKIETRSEFPVSESTSAYAPK